MWYRFSRREDDYCVECSPDGIHYSQMRICHMWKGGGRIRFGVYACSPEDSSFKAVFSGMELTECKWLAHDGQQPDYRPRGGSPYLRPHSSERGVEGRPHAVPSSVP